MSQKRCHYCKYNLPLCQFSLNKKTGLYCQYCDSCLHLRRKRRIDKNPIVITIDAITEEDKHVDITNHVDEDTVIEDDRVTKDKPSSEEYGVMKDNVVESTPEVEDDHVVEDKHVNEDDQIVEDIPDTWVQSSDEDDIVDSDMCVVSTQRIVIPKIVIDQLMNELKSYIDEQFLDTNRKIKNIEDNLHRLLLLTIQFSDIYRNFIGNVREDKY